jgi:hypothetical protein
MRLSTNSDLYGSIRVLSLELQSSGERGWSSALDEALSISTLPGEILGELRLRPRKLSSSNIPVRLGLERQIDEALSYLDHVLGP